MAKRHYSGVPISVPVGFPRPWTIAGYMFLSAAALLVGRIVYEETFLTWTNGPQMVGFAMVHGPVPFILFTGLIGLLCRTLWLIVSMVLLFQKRFRVPLINWIPIILLSALSTLLLIPYATWEEFTVQIAGPGSHGSDFMVQAAVHGKQRFVANLLRKGYDINYEDGGGTTPLSGAAVVGNEKMVSFLVSMGADVNRRDRLTGGTPLMAASVMGKLETVKALLKGGADPCALNKEGHTAAGLAAKYGHTEIAEYLSSRFGCQEQKIDSCASPFVSACVHP